MAVNTSEAVYEHFRYSTAILGAFSFIWPIFRCVVVSLCGCIICIFLNTDDVEHFHRYLFDSSFTLQLQYNEFSFPSIHPSNSPLSNQRSPLSPHLMGPLTAFKRLWVDSALPFKIITLPAGWKVGYSTRVETESSARDCIWQRGS